MENQEIEIKLNYSNRAKITSLLKELGAKFREQYELHDIYFSFHDSMSNEHELVRIREKGDKKELTFKGKCEDKNKIWKRVEISTKLEDSEKMIDILLGLGLKKIRENISKREIYMLNNLEIAFIDFLKPEKLLIIELEGTEDEINDLLAKLGKSVTRIGEEAFKSFDK